MDPKLLSLLGDRRFKCFIQILKGKRCDVLDIDPEKLLAGDQAEIDKVYRFLPELDAVRRQGYDIVGRLVELANRLRSENVKDLAVAISMMINVMFGKQISEEDAKKIGAIIDASKCVKIEGGWVSVDNECLERSEAPEELKDQVRMVTLANLALSAVWSE
jgi:hypothetical protein